MKCNFIQVKFKDKNSINLNKNKILELFKLSFGNININLYYNNNKKESLNQKLNIIYSKTFIKRNYGKMLYINIEDNEEIKIFDEEFISNNIKRTKIFINNRLFDIKENLKYKNQTLKIKIIFLDNIFYLHFMFKDCISLTSVYLLQYLNTKYIKTLLGLFQGCSSLIYIDGKCIWDIYDIYNINYCFFIAIYFLEI